MPTKPNKAGQQQPYVPEGHGDASGEYAEHGTGSNQHYVSPDDAGRQLSYGSSPEETKKKLGFEEEQPKKESETPKELSDKLNGKQSKELQSVSYTEKFLDRNGGKVQISRNSLNSEEISVFNQQIENMFKDYPEMQKFYNISVRNNTKSSTGGYIKTQTIYFRGEGRQERRYELYINSGWLDYKDKKQEYQEKRDRLQKILDNFDIIPDYSRLSTSAQEAYKDMYRKNIAYYNDKMNSNEVSVSVDRIKDRKGRLKSLLSHELMHRITQTFERYNINKYAGDEEKNNALQTRYKEIKQNIRDTYRQAVTNGDARKISTYATTSSDEFLSEANATIEDGVYEVPQYIKDTINNIKEFLRSEK